MTQFSLNKEVINDVMTGNIASEIVDISNLKGYCVHAVWSGTPAGNIIISASNTLVSGDFVTLVTQAVGGAPGKILHNVNEAHYRYVKIDYQFSSSTGQLKVLVSGKA